MNFSCTPIPVYTTQRLVVAQNVRTKAQWCMLGAAERMRDKTSKYAEKNWKQKKKKINTTGKKLSRYKLWIFQTTIQLRST